MCSGASRFSATLRAPRPQHDAESRSAADGEFERRHDAPGGAPFDSDDAKEESSDVAGIGDVLRPQACARVEGAPALGERIEEESGGAVDPLDRAETSRPVDGAGAECEPDTRVPACADVHPDAGRGTADRREDCVETALELRSGRGALLRGDGSRRECDSESQRSGDAEPAGGEADGTAIGVHRRMLSPRMPRPQRGSQMHPPVRAPIRVTVRLASPPSRPLASP